MWSLDLTSVMNPVSIECLIVVVRPTMLADMHRILHIMLSLLGSFNGDDVLDLRHLDVVRWVLDGHTRPRPPACTGCHTDPSLRGLDDRLLTLAWVFKCGPVHQEHPASLILLYNPLGKRCTSASLGSSLISTSVTGLLDMFGLGKGSVSMVVPTIMLVMDITDAIFLAIELNISFGSLHLHKTGSSNPNLLCSNLALVGSLLSPQMWHMWLLSDMFRHDVFTDGRVSTHHPGYSIALLFLQVSHLPL